MTREVWDINAKEWSFRTASGTDLSRKHVLIPSIMRLMSELRGNETLDAGSGSADLGSILRGLRNVRVVQVDFSLEMCRQAASRPGTEGRIICSDVTRLPFKAGSFDTVVANMVLGSVGDLERCCAEFSRVLRPNGVLIFSILHPARVVPAHDTELVNSSNSAGVSASVVEVEDYLHERRVEARLKLGGSDWLPERVEYYHRPLSVYSAALVKNGLVTLCLQEPYPDRDLQDEYPDMVRFWRLAPFLIWVARKQ